VLHDVFIYPEKEKDGWLIEVDAKEAERLAKHIKRYKLRAKFDVRLLDAAEKVVWSLWKEAPSDQWTAHSLDGKEEAVEGIGCEDKRAPGMGRRIILPAGRKPEDDVEEVDEGIYRIRRYLKGVPEGQAELIRESSLPQESNIDFMGGIDYRKGCYIGQELTIRTHHTGVVRKRILPVMLYGNDEAIPDTLEFKPGVDLSADIPAGASIGRVEKRGRSAGKWVAGVGNIGLGLCRLEIMTDTTIQGESGGYQEGDEFKLEWQLEGCEPAMVKIRAFVPPWHLTKQ
jgi:folate-binding protein YgfZ